MKKIYDLTAVIGTYQKNGEDKKRYLTVGAVFQREDGSMSAKLDAVPTNFNGWLNFYEPKFKDAKEAARPPQQDDSEIPF